MVHRNFKDITIPRYVFAPLKPLTKSKINVSLDTETDRGKVFLISDSNDNTFNKKEFGGLYGLLEYLNHARYRSTRNFLWNIDYDTNAVLKYLSFEDRARIAHFNSVDFEDFRIQIIPRKELKVSQINKKGKPVNSTHFYDLCQFYDFMPLSEAAEIVNMKKEYVEDISRVDMNRYNNDDDYKNIWNSRCYSDCVITNLLADRLTGLVEKLVMVHSYKSKASISRRYVLENMNRQLAFPCNAILDASLKAFHAGHIETAKLGVYKNMHLTDANSAYPAYIAQLYETKGEFRRNTEYEPDAIYSYFLVNVDYHDPDFSPIWYLKPDGNYHINGVCETWLEKREFEYFMDHGYDMEVLQARHIIKPKFAEQPFFNLIHDLYKERLKAKDNKDVIERVYKVVLNAIFGVTLNAISKKEIMEIESDIYELVGDEVVYYKKTYTAGNMYNPAYGSSITAGLRSQLFNDFNGHLDKIIGINTDGVYTTQKINVPITRKLGDYSHKKIPKILFMGSGRQFTYDKKDEIDNNQSKFVINDKESRFRSIPLKPSLVESVMLKNPDKKTIELTKEKPIKLKESVRNSSFYNLTMSKFPIQDFNLIDRFNEFEAIVKQIAFKTERRHWFNQVNKIGDLFDMQYESRPLDMTEV